MKKVSIIMATYKTPEQYLKKAIESILNQTYANFEFIIIVDGDLENKAIVEKYNDKRIKIVFNKKNMGLPYSLNKGIDISSGDYILRMDSDDISFKNRIEKQVSFMENNKEIDIAGAYAVTFGEKRAYSFYPFTDYETIKAQLIVRCILVHPTVIIRTATLKGKIKYNESYFTAQDYELWSRMAREYRICIMPFYVLKLRIHKSQASQAKREAQLNNTKNILKMNIDHYFDVDSALKQSILDVLILLSSKEKITKSNYKKIICFFNQYNNISQKNINKDIIKREFKTLLLISLIKSRYINYKLLKLVININNLKYLISKIIIMIKSKMRGMNLKYENN